MRWLYHIREKAQVTLWPYSPLSLATEGFVHASYRDLVVESAGLYFPKGSDLEVLMLDPRKITARVELAVTPRGEMPHVFGPIEEIAVARIVPLAAFREADLPDDVIADGVCM